MEIIVKGKKRKTFSIRSLIFVKPEFNLQDLWIGAYWEKEPFKEKEGVELEGYQIDLWLILIPACPIHLCWTKQIFERK